MKIKSSLKSIKKRDLNSKLLEEEVGFILLIKSIQNLKQTKIILWIMKAIKILGTTLQNCNVGKV